jgi:hypothetical protein
MVRPFEHLSKAALYQLYLDNKTSYCKPVSDHYTYENATEDDEFTNWAFEADAIQEEMAYRWRVAYLFQGPHAEEVATS